jgi:hypothetical protein
MNLRVTAALAASLAFAIPLTAAEAKPSHRHDHHARPAHHVSPAHQARQVQQVRQVRQVRQVPHSHPAPRAVRTIVRVVYDRGEIVSHPSGCPRIAFCGCGVAHYIFGKVNGSMRRLWVAANWLRFPSAAPAPGMAAARAHHVFAIVRVLGPDRVLAYDPNSGGHLTRLHIVSLRGYRVVNPHS